MSIYSARRGKCYALGRRNNIVEIKFWYPAQKGYQGILKGFPKELVTGLRYIPFEAEGHVLFRRSGETAWKQACKVELKKEERLERFTRVKGRALCKTCVKRLTQLDTAEQHKLRAWAEGDTKVFER